MAQIRHYKKIIKLKHFPYKILLVPLFMILAIGIGLAFFYVSFLKDLPSPTNLSKNTGSLSTQIYDRYGTLLYTIYSDRNQTFVPLSKIPKVLQNATIAVEDKDFYHHGAVDFRGITRALYSIIFHKQLQGGSTLTQQLVKNGLLNSERTIQRKIKEVILSFATETMYPKDKILEMYLNQVPYGGTSYGADAASRTYLGKSVKDIDLAEAAYLAGLPEAPSTFSPFGSHPELGKERQEETIIKMHNQEYITKAQMDQAMREPLHFQEITNPIKAPHFVFYIKDLLAKKYGQNIVEQGGLKVTTSLDLTLQDYAQETVASEVAKLTNYKVGNGAAVITNPVTGEILAMVGSKDYFDPKHGNVNITIASLQPGSSIKPINYAVGLMKGYTAATPFVDKQICFPNPGHEQYCPQNYDGKFHGVVQMRFALGNSLNIPAVEMLKLNGLDAMIATASAMGITTLKDPSQYGLSLTLGGGQVTMLDMATAFGVLANQGYRVDLHPILKVTDSKGKILEEYSPPQSPIFGKRVLPSGVTYIITDILSDNNARLMEFGPDSELKIGNQRIAVKTGTTNDFRDNWTIGYTPQYVIAVWVGNNDHTPMAGIASGVTGAAPIWNKLMSHVIEDKKVDWPSKPNDVISRAVCATSGLLPPPDGTADRCPVRFEYFLKSTEPKAIDQPRKPILVDKTTQDIVPTGQPNNTEPRNEVVVTDPLGNNYCLSCPHPSIPPTPTPH